MKIFNQKNFISIKKSIFPINFYSKRNFSIIINNSNNIKNTDNDINNIPKDEISKFFKMSNSKKDYDYRVFLYRDENCTEKISFLNDIPYKNNDGTFNCIFEVPYGETAKMEMSKEEHNPIKQDTKKNKFTNHKYLRHYRLTPLFNYGFIPQTWENSNIKFRNKYIGDDDPLDVIELSIPNKIIDNSSLDNNNDLNKNVFFNNSRVSIGDLNRLHILGSFCLIDQDEVDWKILALNADIFTKDKALKWMDFDENKDRLKSIMNWFKIYKTFEGKKENFILDNDKIFSPEETRIIIEGNHIYYKDAKKL